MVEPPKGSLSVEPPVGSLKIRVRSRNSSGYEVKWTKVRREGGEHMTK